MKNGVQSNDATTCPFCYDSSENAVLDEPNG